MLRTSIRSPSCSQSNRSEDEHHNSSSSKDFNMRQQQQQQQQPQSHQGTPNDVRLLFPMMRRRESCPSVTSSPSIPIAPAERSESEIQLEDDEAKAEFREHAMFQRIFYGIRENNNKKQQTVVPSFNQAVSLPYFPTLPTAISSLDDDHHEVQPLPSAHAAPMLVTWHDMQQQQHLGHHNNMIGREFMFATNNNHSSGPTSCDSSSCCNDEDFVFEMDDM
jgi:hypothetical protein